MGSKRKGRKTETSKDESSALKIKLRGRDNAPLSMQEMCEALLEAARMLKQYETGYRAKFATVYLTMIDEKGQPVRINEPNELVIYPYKTVADEFGI